MGYASDGENLIQDQTNSLPSRLRDQAPGLYVLKCFCNSFHLIDLFGVTSQGTLPVATTLNLMKTNVFLVRRHCDPHKLSS